MTKTDIPGTTSSSPAHFVLPHPLFWNFALEISNLFVICHLGFGASTLKLFCPE